MIFKRKLLKGCTVMMLLSSISSVALAGLQYPDGGVWTYGAANGGAFSNYYHGSRHHSSTVVSRENSHSDKGWADAGETSYAWIKTKWGEKAAFYYNFE